MLVVLLSGCAAAGPYGISLGSPGSTSGESVDLRVTRVEGRLDQMNKRIDAVEWMSADTRARAKAKLATLRIGMGYPERWRDYSSLEVRRDDALGNARRASRFEYRRNLAKLGQPVDHGEWFLLPQTVNALGKNQVELNQGDVRSVNVVQASGRSRVVVNLKRPLTHNVTVDGKRVLVAVGGAVGASFVSAAPASGAADSSSTASAAAPAASAPVVAPVAAQASAAPGGRSLRGIAGVYAGEI